jgi:hypothetical protein
MRKPKLISIYLLIAVTALVLPIVFDYMRPDPSEAQTCVGLTCNTYNVPAPGTANCATGTMTGGGFSTSGDNEPDHIRGYPNGNGWTCDVQQQPGTCYVRCCTLG